MLSKSLEILSNSLKTWSKIAESGNTITNHICHECGSLLFRTSDSYPKTIIIKARCIDKYNAAMEYKLDVKIFTRSRIPWVAVVEGAKQEIGDFTQ